MRFLLDESADARLLPYLRALGHDVTRLASDYPAALSDTRVLIIAQQEQRILIANDRDFGELVFVRRQPHAGVILFRLGQRASIETKIGRLPDVLAHHVRDLDQFLAVGLTSVRIRRRAAGRGQP